MCLEFSAGFMLLASLLWLLDDSGILSALLPAALAHEFGHALALRCCGTRVTRIRFEACGLRMDYSGVLTDGEALLCALAGPGAGLLYAFAAACAGHILGGDYLLCTAGVSLLLSAFNLLPAPMLDGGRALSSLGCGNCRTSGIVCGSTLVTGGAVFLRSSCGPAALLAGVWVLLGTCKYAKQGI